MSESIILTDDELKKLTGYTIASKQIGWLSTNDIKHYVNGAKKPVVLRSTLTQQIPATTNLIVNNQQPNFERI